MILRLAIGLRRVHGVWSTSARSAIRCTRTSSAGHRAAAPARSGEVCPTSNPAFVAPAVCRRALIGGTPVSPPPQAFQERPLRFGRFARQSAQEIDGAPANHPIARRCPRHRETPVTHRHPTLRSPAYRRAAFRANCGVSGPTTSAGNLQRRARVPERVQRRLRPGTRLPGARPVRRGHARTPWVAPVAAPAVEDRSAGDGPAPTTTTEVITCCDQVCGSRPPLRDTIS